MKIFLTLAKYCLLILAMTCAITFDTLAGNVKDSSITTSTVNGWIQKQRNAGFLKNGGQVRDLSGKPCPQVLYSASIQKSNVYLTDKGLVYGFYKYESEPIDRQDEFFIKGAETSKISKGEYARLEMNLIGASIKKENIIEENIADNSFTSFYSGNLGDEALGLHKWHKLIIRNVYPGIDWVLNQDNSTQFKYEFIVAPGANADLIKFSYSGADDVKLNDSKDELFITTPLSTIEEGVLKVYNENNVKFPANYHLENGIISVKIAGNYSKNERLIIDPPVQIDMTWATYFGGFEEETFLGVAISSNNHRVYATGQTWSVFGFPTLYNPAITVQTYVPTNTGHDIVLVCFSTSGVLQYSLQIFSDGNEKGVDVAVDQQGNYFLTGYTDVSASPTYPFLVKAGPGSNYFQPNSGGGIDAFLMKYNSSGYLEWSTLFGGSGDDFGIGVTCGTNDMVLMALSTTSPNLKLQKFGSGFLQPGFYGVQDGFIAGFQIGSTSDIKLQWATYFGGTDRDAISGIVMDDQNKIYACGSTSSTGAGPSNFPVKANGPNAYYQPNNANYPGSYDGFISVFSANTKLEWSTLFGGLGEDFAASIDVNNFFKTIYVCGSTTSLGNDFPIQPSGGNYYQPTNNSVNFWESDAFVAVFRPDYSRSFVSYFGGGGNEQGIGISVGEDGAFFLFGTTINSYNSNPLPFINPNPGPITYYDTQYASNPNGVYEQELFIAEFLVTTDLNLCTLFGKPTIWEYCGDIDVRESYAFLVGGVGTDCPHINNQYTVNPGGGAWYAPTIADPTCPAPPPFYFLDQDCFIIKMENISGSFRQFSEEPLKENSISTIHPNPATDKVTIELNANSENMIDVFIYNVIGKLIKTMSLSKFRNEISVADLSEGLYMFVIKQNNHFQTEKISIIK